MSEALISVLTPAYNTGAYIHRLLNSVLSQTYPLVEMIVVDDGSTDNTAVVVKDFIPQFERRGYALRYVYQENSGQSVAIQHGLQYVQGEYMVWPDSDDYYVSDEVFKKMEEVLASSSSNIGLLRAGISVVMDGTFKVVGGKGRDTMVEESQSLFEDCLLVRNGFYFASGAYMVKMNAFRKVISQPIYMEKNAGQNWQLLLPLLYSYQCISIPDVVLNVVQRVSSHSRGQYRGYEQTLLKYASYEHTITHTLMSIKGMDEVKCANYIRQVRLNYIHMKLYVAFKYKRRSDFNELYDMLCKNEELKQREVLMNLLFYVPGVRLFLQVVGRIL